MVLGPVHVFQKYIEAEGGSCKDAREEEVVAHEIHEGVFSFSFVFVPLGPIGQFGYEDHDVN